MPFVRALAEKTVVVVDDLTIRRPDGTCVDVRAFARPVADVTGAITHVVIAFFDITREAVAERARAESDKRLHRAQRLEAVGTLAGGIAHDFNNLIFGIKLVAGDLAATETDPKRLSSFELIDDITERSAVLTRSLLGFARRGKHRALPVALDDVIEAMRELLVRTLLGLDVSFELGARDRGTVIGDRAQLEQVVMNLVVNARDALRRDSGECRVVVRTRTEGKEVVLEVADNGLGIPVADRDRVFEPYYTTKTQGSERGTGLGLATVYGIVEGHRGSIEVDIGLAGRGTTMRVRLPAAAQAAPRTVVAPASPRLEPGRGLVLVVDDDAIVRRALAATLQGMGYATIEAGGGAEAVEVYRQRRAEIRVVLLDMIMPGMTGPAAFSALREVDPGAVVLLMSGHTSNEEAQALLDRGARGFVAKPYSIDELSRTLAAIMPMR
jgi:signal transduction histidine kinase/CheY-like chemotaxis protein